MIAAPLRKPGCPAAADLEAHAVGDLPELAGHVDACPDCQPYVLGLRGEVQAFVRARPAEQLLKKLERRAAAKPARPWWRWLAVLAPVAAAAALLVVFARPTAAPDDGVTLKGDALRVFVKRGQGDSQPLGADAVVHPGDALRFAFEAPADGYLAVFDLDGTETVTVFFPFGGATAAPVKKAHGLLPGTVVLDEKPGPEWLVAVWAPTRFDTAGVAAQLQGQATRDHLTASCSGCLVSALRLDKRGGAGAP